MELFRALGWLIEPPHEAGQRQADLLELGALPEASEHAEIFLLQLYPFASVYLGNEGKLGGEARDRVGGFWRALGIETPVEPDHLTVLLSFYSELAAQTEASLGAARQQLERTRWAFLWEHLLSWMPLYLDKMRQLGSTFYAAWAELLEEALEEEAANAPRPTELPLHLRAAAPMSDPRSEDGKAFLDSLLAPVRAGMILTHSDLLAAGDEINLAVRAAERRYTLEALLSQDPAACLRWLAAKAETTAEQHRRWHESTGPIAEFWSARATSTATLLTKLAEQAARESR